MYVKILLSNCKFLICTFFLVVIQNVNHILTTEQKKNDFKLSEDQFMDGREYTMVKHSFFIFSF